MIIKAHHYISKMDACARKVKASVKVWPSARASQMVAKCRKQHGIVRKGAAGKSLKRWQEEKWVDTRTGKPCGHPGDSEYCRPTEKVSKKTPVMKPSKKKVAINQARKKKGLRALKV